MFRAAWQPMLRIHRPAVTHAKDWLLAHCLLAHLVLCSLQDYVVRTLWADAQSFETWATGPGRSWGQYEALPDEVRQYAPRGRGDGVPESYVAFRAGSPPPDPQ
jgi:hypothetical protein